MGQPVENYIIRVYRRDEKDPVMVTGVIEEVGSDRSVSFRSMEELVKVLLRQNKDACLEKWIRLCPERLKLKLPVRIEGVDAGGRPFTEETTLEDLSACEAYFFMRNSVNIDAGLRLVMDPSGAGLEMQGKVIDMEAGQDGNRVGMLFDTGKKR